MKKATIYLPAGTVTATAHYASSAFREPGYQIRVDIDGVLYEGYSSYSNQYHGEPWAIQATIRKAMRDAFRAPFARVDVDLGYTIP